MKIISKKSKSCNGLLAEVCNQGVKSVSEGTLSKKEAKRQEREWRIAKDRANRLKEQGGLSKYARKRKAEGCAVEPVPLARIEPKMKD